MPSKTSSFKKELLKQDFRNVGWIGIIYLLGLLFALPLQLIMQLTDDHYSTGNEGGLFAYYFLYEFQLIFLFALPVLMAIFLYRYLHVKAASDFTHSLPIRREKQFHYRVLSGTIILLAPILITGLIMLLFIWFGDMSLFYDYSDLGYWVLMMSVMSLVIFLAGVLVGMVTGLSAVQGVLTYILLLFPIGVYMLTAYNVRLYISGLAGHINISETLSPLTNAARIDRATSEMIPVDAISLAVYAGIGLLFYLAALFIYKKRHLEAASQAIAFHGLKPLFKFGVTVCFALFAGMYFGETEGMLYWAVFGYIAGGVLGYFASTMLLEKTWRVFALKHWRGLITYGIGTAIVLAVLPFLWQRFETYIPETAAVEKAFIGQYYYEYQNMKSLENASFITSEEGIQDIKDVHQALIENADPLNQDGRSFFIAYELEDGEVIHRSYRVAPDLIEGELKELSKSEDYKEMEYRITSLSSNEVMRVTIEPQRPMMGTQASFVDPDKIKEFLEVVKKDIYDLTYEEMIAPEGVSSRVLIVGGEEGMYDFSLNRSFDQTIEWLKSEGLYDEAFIQGEDFHHAEIYPWPADASHRHQAYFQMKETSVEPLIIKDKKKIDDLLAAKETETRTEYVVAFYFSESGNEPIVLGLSSEDAPAFIE